ncbi:MAG: hypothetical protein M1511_12575 [Deltaproteobacteria bacterium]|nr:hypothetical protein [Deltaproteobacteria bacterium]
MNTQTQLTIYDWLGKLPGAVLAIISTCLLLGFAYYVWQVFGKVKNKEDQIFAVKDEIDNLEMTMHKKRGPVSQPVLDKIVERERKPLEAKLEKLKMERQYLLDRVSIFGLVKK